MLDRADLPAFRTIAEIRKALGLRGAMGVIDDPADDEDDDSAEPAEADDEVSTWQLHHNVIFFGPPGTGKSYTVNQIVKETLEAEVHRVTFHPEYSYFDFVGMFRPCVGWLETASRFTGADGSADRREPRVYYGFEPGPFSRALASAARNPERNVVLIIEEINRGNCAAIFGDVFQLLDRAADAGKRVHGVSEYPIRPSAEWAAWLSGELGDGSEVWKDGSLRLPANLYLYATMNTSDQSLFPMDTAFRRRWGMSYRGIEAPAGLKTRIPLHAGDTVGMPWVHFAGPINREIVAHKGTDDMQMGPYFVRPQPGTSLVTPLEFSSKVLFYLWADVFRDGPNRIFRDGIATYDELVARYENAHEVFRLELFGRATEVTEDDLGDPIE
jgi:hypothetical protein